MAAKIETAFLINTEPGTESASVDEFATPVSAVSSPKGASCTSFPTQTDVGNVPQGLSDEAREQAIERAAALVEYLHALSQVHWALLNGQGDYFTHKAAYDMALSDCHAAREIMERLIKGRSAAQIARMERQRGLDLPACANEERQA